MHWQPLHFFYFLFFPSSVSFSFVPFLFLCSFFTQYICAFHVSFCLAPPLLLPPAPPLLLASPSSTSFRAPKRRPFLFRTAIDGWLITGRDEPSGTARALAVWLAWLDSIFLFRALLLLLTSPACLFSLTLSTPVCLSASQPPTPISISRAPRPPLPLSSWPSHALVPFSSSAQTRLMKTLSLALFHPRRYVLVAEHTKKITLTVSPNMP